MFLALYGLGLFAVAVYFVQSDAAPFGKPLDRDWPKLSTVLAALWPAIWLFAALPILLAEFSFGAVARAPKLEVARIRDAVWSGVGLAGAIVFAFAVTYIGAERDVKFDLSYFRTARPGESTRKLARTMDQPIAGLALLPARQRGQRRGRELLRRSRQGRVEAASRSSTTTATSTRRRPRSSASAATASWWWRAGSTASRCLSASSSTAARGQLRNLDRDVQQRLLKVAKPARTVYFVTGHGERGFDPAGDTDKRGTVRDLRELLTQQGYNIRTLGAAEGLGADVPSDAGIVARHRADRSRCCPRSRRR